jgi:homoserine O-acetyltransferase/O-succinyltransferase
MSDYEIFEATQFQLLKGPLLPKVRIAYQTMGTLAADGGNVVLMPSWYTGTWEDTARTFVGPGRAIDPAKYFVVLVDLLGNGLSSSPSNMPPPYDRARFPHVTFWDNIRLQHMLVTQRLGISRIRLVTSASMGGCQSFQWAAQYPEMVEACAPIVGSARTAEFNKVFLLSLERALRLDPAFAEGYYTDPPVRGLKAFAAIYAGWGFSEPFYRSAGYRQFNARDHEEFVRYMWEPVFLRCDANNLLSQLATWRDGDISDNPLHGGDFEKALKSIRARTIILPGQHDTYFPPADSELEARRMPRAECRPIPSIWGHMCTANPADAPFIDKALAELLEG